MSKAAAPAPAQAAAPQQATQAADAKPTPENQTNRAVVREGANDVINSPSAAVDPLNGANRATPGASGSASMMG